MSSLFVTGVDTAVGKTQVSAAILRAMRRRGLTVGALKPIESGCDPDGDPLRRRDDASELARACGSTSFSDCSIYRLRAPIAPRSAAQQDGITIDLARVVAHARAGADRHGFYLVEGAGGLLVPITDGAMVADLAVALAMPVLVVARAGLGTINHALLTLEALRHRGLTVAGVVLNATTPTPDADARRNADEVARISGVPILGIVPHAADPTTIDAEAHLDLAPLLA